MLLTIYEFKRANVKFSIIALQFFCGQMFAFFGGKLIDGRKVKYDYKSSNIKKLYQDLYW